MKNGFERGSGCYKCRICKKLTRSTGRGDNENVRLCVKCFDMAGDANSVLDGQMIEAEFAATWSMTFEDWQNLSD